MPNDTVVSPVESMGADRIRRRRDAAGDGRVDAPRSVRHEDWGVQSRNAIRNTSAGCRARRPTPSRI